jgi:hypothetical protein
VKRRDARLVPVAEFRDRASAEEAWAALDEAGIPASVVTDPASLGSSPVTRVYVARISAEEAQRVIASIVGRAGR